jgi:hypothetical protein
MPSKGFIVPGSIWDKRFRDLNDDSKIIMLYVWTQPMRTTEGIWDFRVHYAAADTKRDESSVKSALRELEDAGFILWDAEHEVVLDLTALGLMKIRNGRDRVTGEIKRDKRIPKALAILEGFADTPLLGRFLELAEAEAPDLARAMRDHFAALDDNVTSLPRRKAL